MQSLQNGTITSTILHLVRLLLRLFVKGIHSESYVLSAVIPSAQPCIAQTLKGIELLNELLASKVYTPCLPARQLGPTCTLSAPEPV